jgi:hypothetical protein
MGRFHQLIITYGSPWVCPCTSCSFLVNVSAPVEGQLLHNRRDVIKALWDKAWRDSEDTENVYFDRMRLMRVALEDIHLCKGKLGKYLIR